MEDNSDVGYVNYANFPEGDKPMPPPGGTPDRRKIANSIPNPIYSRQPEELPIVSGRKKKPPVPVPRPQMASIPLRTLPGRRNKQTANKRDCHARALKVHIEDIVDGIIFKESELPEVLTSSGCLTDDECRTIREKVDRKDQARILVTVIKSRDLDILKKFVDFIGEHNEDLARKIRHTVEENIILGFRERKCLVCKLKSQVNVKYVADKLWAEDCIKDDLYNELVYNEKPTGVQDKLWERILECSVGRRMFETLENALRVKGHYVHIADDIQKVLSNNREPLECMCQIHIRLSAILSSSTSASDAGPASSYSFIKDRNSFEILSSDGGSSEINLQHGSPTMQENTAGVRDVKHREVVTEQTFVKGTLNVVAEGDDEPPPLPKKKHSNSDQEAAEAVDESHTTYV